MISKYSVAKFNAKLSERWYTNNLDKFEIGAINRMFRISTGSRTKPKTKYSEKLKATILNAI